jgi:hypothetical protein
MSNKTLILSALGLALLVPSVLPGAGVSEAFADDSRVWVEGHTERRETRRPIPAEERRDWVAPRYVDVVIPAVTERVRVPAVVEQVRVTERVWIPEVAERHWVHGYWDLRGWRPAHYERRVVEEGRFEDRAVQPERYESRVVVPESWETRIVTPERVEQRLVESGHWQTVVVRPAREEVTVEKVWIPGHWESR